jgi:hypothetical protein
LILVYVHCLIWAYVSLPEIFPAPYHSSSFCYGNAARVSSGVGLALRLVISALLLSVVSVGRRVFSCRERRMGMIANIN